MAKKELPFAKYKNRLFDYLHMQGIQAEENQLCPCCWHDDSTPSLSFFTDGEGFPRFKCFGCGREGDIYNAVEYCTGETDPKKQFEEIERIFGDGSHTPAQFTPPPKKERFRFTPNKDALEKLSAWLSALPNKEENVLSYFKQRIEYKTGGKEWQYPLSEEELRRLVTYFFWWPGARVAENALGRPLLFAAGVAYAKTKNGVQSVEERETLSEFPQVGKDGKIYLELTTDTCYLWNKEDFKYEKAASEPREVAWWHTGVLAKSPEGFKLLYMDEKTLESMKKNPRTGVSFFPIPTELPESKPIIIMEGEVDAILCQTIGIENAFSMGGLGNLSVPKIQKYILPKNIPEIILFADNDKAPKCQSQKAFGMIPYDEGDAVMETVPEKLIRAGYAGKIKVTSLPADCGFKDPDDAIRNGKRELVFEAIKNAREYSAPEKPAKKGRKTAKENKASETQIDGTIYKDYDTVPLKFFKSVLKKIPYETLQPDDVTPFLCAAYKTCKDDGAVDALVSWCSEAFDESEIKKFAKEDYTPFHLLKLLAKYELSSYYLAKLEDYLVPAKELLRLFKIKETIIPIDYEKALESKKLQAFLDKKGNHSAADFLADVADGNIIYLIEDKANYAYNGLKWCMVPGLASAAHDILQNILIKYLEKHLDQKDFVNKVLEQIESRRFRTELVHDFNELPQVACGKSVEKAIMFDSLPIRATLTLKDGVIDYSGGELKKRPSRRDEYRRTSLPYTVSEVMNAQKPVKFLSLMESNFKPADEATLKKNPTTTVETLMYYLSLIQSRDTSRRYGGFFLGTGGTGKPTLLKILSAIYPGCTVALNENLLVSVTKHFDNPNGPTPEMAKLEGMLFGYISETPEHGKLNETIFKRLTGGDVITARTLHHEPHDFYQTAQIGIASNNSPSFSHSETAAIDRMMIFRFNVKHEKGLKESKTPEEIIEWLRPEFPAIIKYFAEKYIDLNINLKGKIPMSTECINEKGLYIDAQANDTDRFISLCLQFDMNNDGAFLASKQLYACYLKMLEAVYNKEFREDSKETPSQRQFTTWLKTRVEFQNTYKQKRLSDFELPEWGFEHVAFTDYALKLLQKTPPQEPAGATGLIPPPPEEDPFADAAPVPPTAPESSGGGGKYDIF